MSSEKRNIYCEDGLNTPENRALLSELLEGGEERLAREPILKHIPFCEALGMRMLALGPGESLLATPYHADLIGYPQNGVIHGGVVTTLIDTAAGMAAAMGPGFEIKPMATLDLRIDYMRPAEPGKAIFSKARCFRRARNIAFVRAIAFENREDDPLAMGVGVFMPGGKVTEKSGAEAKASDADSAKASKQSDGAEKPAKPQGGAKKSGGGA